MTVMTAADPSEHLLANAVARRPAYAGTACLATVIVLAWAFSLGRSLADPIGPDQALYQYMAERIAFGDRLYVDTWDQNGPGIVLLHWLAIHVTGRSPLAFRAFDAGWQLLTLITLMGLVLRQTGRWRAAWLAGGIYVLSYYSLGYVQTGQREGFAVLPLLLSVHLVSGPRAGMMKHVLAGVLNAFVFAIKPPLGACFGALWICGLAEMRHSVRDGLRRVTALSVGFVLGAGAGVAWLWRLGSWDGFWGVLSRRDMPGYILGPALIRSALPQLLTGGALLALVLYAIQYRGPAARTRSRCFRKALGVLSGSGYQAGLALYTLLITARLWPAWQHVLILFAGLWIPTAGAMIGHRWQMRDRGWRLNVIMLLACWLALVLQGQFFLYHLPPLLAFAAMLSGMELDERLADLSNPHHARKAWAATCLACVCYLAVGQWWSTMAMVSSKPYVLAGTTLANHYTRITRHKLSCPTYATTVSVADRIRELAGEHDPVACLMHEPRIFLFARRPCVHKLIAMQSAYQHLFGDYMQAIRDRRPKVVVTRIPEPLRTSRDMPAIEAAVFEETERFFGPPGRTVRELYRVTQVIDDVCVLQPRK